MLNRLAQIQKLRDEGLTFAEIGLKFGLSKQRVYQIFHPEYHRTYSKTPQRRAYQRAYYRHFYHLQVNKKFKNCEKCNRKLGEFDLIKAIKYRQKIMSQPKPSKHSHDRIIGFWEGMNFGFEQSLSLVKHWFDPDWHKK